MGKSCCVEGCNVSSLDVEYFKFPRSGALLAAWVEATGAPAGDVCSAHFTDDDYKNMRGKRRLLGTAVPSVLLNIPPSKNKNGEISSSTPKNTKKGKTNSKNKKSKEKKSIETPKPDSTTDNETEDSTDSKVPEDKTETIDNRVSDSSTSSIEKVNEDGESSQDSVDTTTEVSKENGKEKSLENVQPEVNDIEDMITNYQIKQTKTLADRLNPEPLEDLIPTIMAQQTMAEPQRNQTDTQRKQTDTQRNQTDTQRNQTETQRNPTEDTPRQGNHVQNQGNQTRPGRVDVGELASHLSNKLDNQLAQIMAAAPVFIEVAVEQGENRASSPQDCVMLLESVQCDIDPASLMLPVHDPDSDMEIVEGDDKIEDPNPISLLTSSDEDEVIIEEPHIDTVEVSDETDEDDKPLQTLVATKPTKTKPVKPKKKSKSDWGHEFYCAQCDFKTDSEVDFKQHTLEFSHHSTTIHVCSTCNYSTASKAQFSRHKRKHRDERNFKCHLCNYKARHNMSLIYHLKSHAPVDKKEEKFTCDKCGFSTNVKSEALKHLKAKVCVGGNKYSCDQCSYSTKRRSDLRRHRQRRHSADDSDEDFTFNIINGWFWGL